MSYPTKYTRQYDYVAYQNANPTRPLPATSVHADLNAAAESSSEIVDFLKTSIRSDGAIMNGAVGYDQLSSDLQAITGDPSAIHDILDQAAASAAAAASSATTAADNANTAANSATAASSSATAAAGSATAASGSATAAAGSATAASGSATAAASSATAAAANATVVAGDLYTFETSTTMAAPATGAVRFNNATLASVTALALNAQSAANGNPNVRSFLAQWGASSNTIKGVLELRKIGTPSTFAIFNIIGAVTDNTSWLQVPVAYVTGNGAFSAADSFTIQYSRCGDVGPVLTAAISPGGRLTLLSGTAVMGASQTGAGTIYYTPCAGNLVPVTTDGTTFSNRAFSELSQALTDTTKSPAAAAANKIYDMFVWDDGGTLRCTRGPAWTNSSTRGYTFTVVNGVPLNTSSVTNGPAALRGTWVGTIATNGSGTCDWTFGGAASGGSAASLNVWNAYNRVDVMTTVVDNGAASPYTSTTIRQARASSGNQISFVTGSQEDGAFIDYVGFAGGVASSAFYRMGIGYDVTNAFSNIYGFHVFSSAVSETMRSDMFVTPAAGTHTIAAVEQGDGTNANTFNQGTLGFRFRM